MFVSGWTPEYLQQLSAKERWEKIRLLVDSLPCTTYAQNPCKCNRHQALKLIEEEIAK